MEEIRNYLVNLPIFPCTFEKSLSTKFYIRISLNHPILINMRFVRFIVLYIRLNQKNQASAVEVLSVSTEYSILGLYFWYSILWFNS